MHSSFVFTICTLDVIAILPAVPSEQFQHCQQLQGCQQLRREYLQGATYKAIAEKYKIDQHTAKRYVQLNLPLEEYEHRPYQSILTQYLGLIRKWILSDHLSSAQVHRLLQENGCHCSYSLVNRAVQKILRDASAVPSSVNEKTVNNKGEQTACFPGPAGAASAKPVPVKPISMKIKKEKQYVKHPHN